MNFLCDTNVISELMRPIPEPNVKQWLNEREIIYLSVITIEEIYFGLAYKEAKRQLEWFEKLLRFRCNILPVSLLIARHCGVLRGEFRKRGITRTQADLLIAATAKAHDLALVTRNVRDFQDCGIQLLNPFGDE